MIPYEPPQRGLSAFNCPLCHAYASQTWRQAAGVDQLGNIYPIKNFSVAYCHRCTECSIWEYGVMVYPPQSTAPDANPDMPDDIKTDYEEAREIASRSPRGAAALLRLVIEKLCIVLQAKGQNLNEQIGDLVRKGLRADVQRALDGIRVMAAEGVHPGTIDLRDNPETAQRLFLLVNIIVQDMVSNPKQIQAVFDSLPEGKKQAIKGRDGGPTPEGGESP